MLKLQHTYLFLFAVVALFLQSCGEYSKTDSGLRYKINYDSAGNVPQIGEAIYFKSYIYNQKDSLLRQSNDDGILISKDFEMGSMEEGVRLLSAGDSATFLISVDSFFAKSVKQPIPAYLEKGTDLKFVVKVTKVLSKDQVAKERQDQMAAYTNMRVMRMSEFKKQYIAADSIQTQLKEDEKTIKAYLSKNNLKAERSENGVYYVITAPGNGSPFAPGDSVKIHYTGKLIDGTQFDSSVGKDVFQFVLGTGDVIMGWDEGVLKLKRGEKATLIIPSVLGYGGQGQGSIPPNACLIFDVEVQN